MLSWCIKSVEFEVFEVWHTLRFLSKYIYGARSCTHGTRLLFSLIIVRALGSGQLRCSGLAPEVMFSFAATIPW